MKLYIAIIVAIVLAVPPSARAAGRAVVLVTSRDCAMDTIIALDIRKAYLGIVVSYDDHIIRPFRLSNDEQLDQIFFQYIVAMSEKTYERHLLRLLLQHGQPRPREFDVAARVAAAVVDNQCSIAYMWKSDAEMWPGIKAIKSLWQEN